MSPLWSLLIGVTAGTALPFFTVIAVRRRTGSEADHNEATAADVLAQGAVRLIPFYEGRIADLERRLAATEAATLVAQQTATSAREAEARCLARLDAMQAQIDGLLAQHAHPPDTTTVTTRTTTTAPHEGDPT